MHIECFGLFTRIRIGQTHWNCVWANKQPPIQHNTECKRISTQWAHAQTQKKHVANNTNTNKREPIKAKIAPMPTIAIKSSEKLLAEIDYSCKAKQSKKSVRKKSHPVCSAIMLTKYKLNTCHFSFLVISSAVCVCAFELFASSIFISFHMFSIFHSFISFVVDTKRERASARISEIFRESSNGIEKITWAAYKKHSLSLLQLFRTKSFCCPQKRSFFFSSLFD